MFAPPLQLPAGQVLGERWRIERCISAGGMGAVYEAVHVETQGRCALKVMLPELADSPELCARFRQEAVLTAKVQSDHIVRVFDAGTDDPTGINYLAMELLAGEDLGKRVASRGPLPFDETLQLMRQAAHALTRAHAADIVHRDLKPENLFVTRRDDGSPCLKVLDFGIAKLVARGHRAPTTLALGTPLYMAPEQVRGDGDIGPAADIYTLGQVTFTLLAGEPYFGIEAASPHGTFKVMQAISAGTREPAMARTTRPLPPAFDVWFARATALEPGARFATVAELVAELAAALEGGGA